MIISRQKRFFELMFISAALAVLVAWFFRDALFSGKIFVERDLSRYYYPLRFFAVNCAKQGIFPFWNPYIFCGNPLFASLQSSVLYPPSFIYYIGDFSRAFNFFIAAHFFLAGLFTYAFMRTMRYSAFAAVLAAAGFALSGYMTSVVNLVTTLSSVAWFPLAVLFYYKMIKASEGKNNVILRSRDEAAATKNLKERFFASLRMTYCLYAIMLGVVFTLMFLAGEPSVLYMAMALFFCGSVYFTVEEFLEKKKLNLLYIKGAALSVMAFIGLSAFQLLPFLEFLKISSRESPNFEMSGIWNLPIKDIPGIVFPFFHDIYKLFIGYWQRQSWLDNYYTGLLIFIFFVMAVFFDRSKKARAVFILGLLGFIISLGRASAAFDILYNFAPGFKFMRYSVRFFFIPVFAICVLAGAGLDYYSKFIKIDKRLKTAAFAMLALAFLSSIAFLALDIKFENCFEFVKSFATNAALRVNMSKAYVQDAVSLPVFSEFLRIDLVNIKRLLLFLTFFGALFYFGCKGKTRQNIFVVPVFVFLAIMDIYHVNGGYSPLVDIKKFTSPSANVRYLFDRSREGLFRVCCSPQTAREHSYVPEKDISKGLEASKDRLITNRASEFAIFDVNMYGSLYNNRNSKFLNLIMDKKSKNLEKLLALLNVRFVASPRQPKLVGFKLANSAEAANLYETGWYLPRAFLAENALIIKDEAEILKRMADGEFDPAKEVILEETIEPALDSSPAAFGGKAQNDKCIITSYTPNKIIIEAAVVSKPKFLVLSDTYYPGWKALVDGKRVKIYRADYILRAVYLEPGAHSVEFFYSPFSFKLGVFITVLSCLIILTFIAYYNIIKK